MLPKDINTLKNSFFQYAPLSIRWCNKKQTNKIMTKLYNSNIQIKKEKTASLYHWIDSAIFWFINTKGCKRCFGLACFISKVRNKQSSDCCDNYINDHWNDILSKILTFNWHNIRACHYRWYLFTQKYKRSIIEAKQRNLMMHKGQYIKKTSVAQHKRCKLALDKFVFYK